MRKFCSKILKYYIILIFWPFCPKIKNWADDGLNDQKQLGRKIFGPLNQSSQYVCDGVPPCGKRWSGKRACPLRGVGDTR